MKIISFLILTVLLTSEIFPQKSTYEFLRMDMSARAGALAGSFTSNNDDANVIFYNPAGIKLLEGNPVSLSFVKHLLDINMASISYSFDYNDLGKFGAAIKYINYGSFEKIDEFGSKEGNFSANEAALIIGYSNILDENFYYGFNGKFIYSGIESRSSTALAFDAGLHYYIPSQEINIGFSILNIGEQLSTYYSTKESLPLDIIIGISKKLEHLPLRLSLDFHKLNEERDELIQKLKAFTIGAEFTLSKVLKLRFGYDNEKRTEMKIGSFAGLAGFNAGLGALVSGYQFDYGFSSWGDIGTLHRISISTNL